MEKEFRERRIKQMRIRRDDLDNLSLLFSTKRQNGILTVVICDDIPGGVKIVDMEWEYNSGCLLLTLWHPSWPIENVSPPMVEPVFGQERFRLLSTICQQCGHDENAVVTEGRHATEGVYAHEC